MLNIIIVFAVIIGLLSSCENARLKYDDSLTLRHGSASPRLNSKKFEIFSIEDLRHKIQFLDIPYEYVHHDLCV